jgi:conjugal transfer pilus assembly protein TraE
MKWKKFFTTWDGVRFENRMQRYVIFGLIASNVIVGLAAFTRGEVVVLTPPELTQPMKVARDRADQSFSESWSLVMAGLLGNVTPGNADNLKRLVTPMLAPSVYQDVVNALSRQVEQIKLDRVTIRFEPREVIFEPRTEKVFVVGNSIVAGPMGRDDRGVRTYELIVKVRAYQPYVTHLETYRGQPRTLENLARMNKTVSRAAIADAAADAPETAR